LPIKIAWALLGLGLPLLALTGFLMWQRKQRRAKAAARIS
jgi:uncharacterized iron-regulated membrane protein